MADRVVLCLANDTNEYQKSIQRDAEDAARRVGFELEVLSAGGVATQQAQWLSDRLRGGKATLPRAVVVFPVRDASLKRVADEAARAGVGWVVLNWRSDYLDELRRAFPQVPVGLVGPDQVEAGRLQGRQARALLGRAGVVLHVLGPTLSSAAQDRRTGLLEELQGAGIEVAQVSGNWRTDVAEQAVEDWLRVVLPSRLRVGVVVCQNDSMAVGARNALDRVAAQAGRPELTKVPVTGMDGQASVGQRLVDEKRLAATIVQPSSGAAAIDWLVQALRGQRVQPTVVLPLVSYPALDELSRRGQGGELG
jgi:ABC-type sugar transport system substrate-binding protein